MTPAELRELLALAAKAAGIEIDFPIMSAGAMPVALLRSSWTNTVPTFWSPYADDADAFRLLTTPHLNLQLVVNDTSDRACVTDGGLNVQFAEHGSDARAAIRLAILRAAAEVGRNMP